MKYASSLVDESSSSGDWSLSPRVPIGTSAWDLFRRNSLRALVRISLVAPNLYSLRDSHLRPVGQRAGLVAFWYQRHGQSLANDCLGFLQNAAEMISSAEALRIDLVDVFRSGRTRREPSTLSYHF